VATGFTTGSDRNKLFKSRYIPRKAPDFWTLNLHSAVSKGWNSELSGEGKKKI
jgi:hypothetical protein